MCHSNMKLVTTCWTHFAIFMSCTLQAIAENPRDFVIQGLTGHPYQKSKEVNLLAVGDWGGLAIEPYYTKYEMGTSKSMAKKGEEIDAVCVISLGDNFYTYGVANEFDPRFNQTFEAVFNDSPLTDIPWYVLAGNHDYVGNITAQVEYTKHSERWMFPYLWYTVTIPATDFNITIVMIDTVVLCGETVLDIDNGTINWNSTHPNGPIDPEQAEEQWNYIENKLSTSKSEYLLVMGHYPVYSISEHGTEPCVYNRLKPMLEKYNATMYMAGHAHQLQHISANEVDYFINGAGNAVNIRKGNLDTIPRGSLQYYWAEKRSLGGYASLSANRTHMKVRFHGSENTDTLYETVKKARNSATEIFKLSCWALCFVLLRIGIEIF